MSKLSESQKMEIKAIISEKLQVGEDEVQDDSNLQRQLGSDSLDYTEIIISLEEKFDISVPDEDFDFGNETLVSNLFEIVERYIQ